MHIKNFFTEHLAVSDSKIYEIIEREKKRQSTSLELIASENIVSQAVLQAQGSVLTNKYAEGYPGKRYYNGCQYVDVVEEIAIERAKELFNANFVNVQPHSGSQANQAVFLALLKPGDKILSLSLDCGGHLTHGSTVNQSGKWFQAVHYSVSKETFLIDYDEVEKLAKEHKPKLIIAGYSAYPRAIDFSKFREIADLVGAYLLVDMAHISGIIAAKLHQSPMDYAHVVTTTTHKTLRGPRGGMILTNHDDIAKLVNSAIFPGLQGGPLMHVIAAKAVAFGEALQEDYKIYMQNVILNAQTLANRLISRGFQVITGGTDNHLLIIDLRSNNITGKDLTTSLEKANITCNKNSIPFDVQKPTITSGARMGSAACTTRGLQAKHFVQIGDWVADIIECMAKDAGKLVQLEASIKSQVIQLCEEFPIY